MELFFPVKKQAKVSVTGDPLLSDQLWVVCHGYGQLSRYFIRKFEILSQQNVCVVAPEGLHRFYLKGHSGRVGASWMTSEERIKDIEDYVDYLDEITSHFTSENIKSITGLGFSQGAATISRWASLGKVKPDNLVLWSSVFPPDLPPDNIKKSKQKMFYAYGDQDEFLSVNQFKEHYEDLKKSGINIEEYPFKGTHDIYPETLLEIFNQLKNT